MTTTTHDKPRLTARQRAREAAHFQKVRRAETTYSLALRKVARHVADLIRAFPVADLRILPEVNSILSRYADILRPWARSAAARMIAEVSRRDEQAWFKSSETMGRNLRQEISSAPIGDEVRRILENQVELITSIPIEAARRVQSLALEHAEGGRRYEDLVRMIEDTGNVTVARANLIARTEVAKASSALTTARAKAVGVTHFIWETARDRDVRPLHKKLQGRVFEIDNPPVIGEKGERGLPGEIYNCRCFMSPIIPDTIE